MNTSKNTQLRKWCLVETGLGDLRKEGPPPRVWDQCPCCLKAPDEGNATIIAMKATIGWLHEAMCWPVILLHQRLGRVWGPELTALLVECCRERGTECTRRKYRARWTLMQLQQRTWNWGKIKGVYCRKEQWWPQGKPKAVLMFEKLAWVEEPICCCINTWSITWGEALGFLDSFLGQR